MVKSRVKRRPPAPSKCRDCGAVRVIPRFSYFKAARPKCFGCGGLMEYLGGWQGSTHRGVVREREPPERSHGPPYQGPPTKAERRAAKKARRAEPVPVSYEWPYFRETYTVPYYPTVRSDGKPTR